MRAVALRRVDIGGIHLQISALLLLVGAVLLPLLPGHAGLICPLRTMTGIPCPLCGMTTSVVATSRGRFSEALAANPAGVVFVIGAVALLIVRPKKVRLPVAALIAAALAMWVFQLFRFSVL
ncbi:MAG TPA: DUF2752 domain-containing protein [Actinomycetota bacterium]|nr:DUF2752 domain-containing protein [Actinomycetota bacterium]